MTSALKHISWAPFSFKEPSQHLPSKITMIALASLVFFSLQMQTGFILSLQITALVTGAVYLLENTLRPSKSIENAWVSLSSIHYDKLTLFMLSLKVYQCLKACLLFGRIQSIPFQKIASDIARLDLKMMSISLIIAPVVEEILFRGFLQEQFLNLLTLCNKYIVPVSEKMQKITAIALQSLLFSSMHIFFGQTLGLSSTIIVLSETFLMGLIHGDLAMTQKTLIIPMALHALSNLHSTICILSKS